MNNNLSVKPKTPEYTVFQTEVVYKKHIFFKNNNNILNNTE